METIAQIRDREIHDVLMPSTFLSAPESSRVMTRGIRAIGVFIPMLEEKRKEIEEIPKKTYKYGSTDRHQVRHNNNWGR
jgi:hypothetical protein